MKKEKYFTEKMAMEIYPFQPKISRVGKETAHSLSDGKRKPNKSTIRKNYVGK